MKTQPVIRIENPKAGSVPATLEQLHALGVTDAEIAAGEKRLESTHVGPWHICTSLRGIVERAQFDRDAFPVKTEWKEFYPVRTMSRPRPMGFDMEGHISLNGKRVSAFTSSQLFELPGGRLIDVAVIFARNK